MKKIIVHKRCLECKKGEMIAYIPEYGIGFNHYHKCNVCKIVEVYNIKFPYEKIEYEIIEMEHEWK